MLIVVAVLLLWAAVVTVLSLDAYSKAKAGARELREAKARFSQTAASDDDPLESGRQAQLADAEAKLSSAASDLGSPLMVPVRITPVVGRQVRTAEDLANGGAVVAAAASDLLGELKRIKDSADLHSGKGRVDALEELNRALRVALAKLDEIDLGSGQALVGPLQRQYDEFASQLADLTEKLEKARDVTAGLASFLRGPSRYLVLAANNAEMRAGSGMFLSAGLLEASGGDIKMSEVRSITELPVPTEPLEGVDADFQRNFGWTEFQREWRNLAASPRFDVTAEIAAQMWKKSGNAPIDGVLVIDPVALQAVLTAAGPTRIDNERIDKDSVVQYLLHDQYAEFAKNPERRDFLARVAAAALDKVRTGDFDLMRMGRQLARAASGRHLLAWSSNPVQQAGWEAAGISGRLSDDTLILTLQNRATNKTDPFLAVSSVLSIGEDVDANGTVAASVSVTITNEVPAQGEVQYVVGPDPNAQTSEGQYVGILALNLPAFATVLPPDPAAPLTVDGPDGANWMRGYVVDLQRGQNATYVFTFRLPAGPLSMKVAPSARVPPVQWAYRDQQWVDDHTEVVSWS